MRGIAIMTTPGSLRGPWEPIIVEGKTIAWGGLCDGKGGNAKCRIAYGANHPYHIIPAHDDPRGENAHLALPTWHAPNRDEAIEMLQKGWETPVSVDNAHDRDAAYARGIPFLIMKGGRY